MKRVLKKLAERYILLEHFVPDGKLYIHNELFYYVGFQDYSDKTGEPFYTVFYGAFDDEEGTLEYCTLENSTLIDQMKIKKRQKRAYKLLQEMQPESEKPKPDDSKVFIIAMGFKDKDYFFTTSDNKQLICIRSFHESDMLNMMPLSYWETSFPGNGATRVDWALAKSTLMEKARKKGIFQPRKIRGSGVWNDSGRIVVNMGTHLIVDGIRTELHQIKSWYFYTMSTSLNELHNEPLTVAGCEPLVKACETFKWVKPDYGYLCGGALVLSRICGALPIRPHVWVTGGSSTGKSTLMERLITPLLGRNQIYVFGPTTEAGIRQSLGADAVPVLFDEFETTSQKSSETISAVVDLLRSAWSDSHAVVLKGGAGGTATAYQIRCSAIVSSVRVNLTNDADRSRFAQIELQPHNSDPDHWKILSDYLTKIDNEFAERLFARTISMVPILIQNYKIMKAVLARRVSQRFGDQYGMLLGAYAILLQDDAITESQANTMADWVKLEDEKQESKVTDHEDCLTALQTRKIRFEKDSNTYERSISELIQIAHSGDTQVNEALQRFGIKVSFDSVAVASNHSELESQVFRGDRWSKKWANSLSRFVGTEKNKPVWMAGKTQRCILIPWSVFEKKI